MSELQPPMSESEFKQPPMPELVSQRIDFDHLPNIKPIPSGDYLGCYPDGDYVVYKPDDVWVGGSGQWPQYKIWFTTPALDPITIKRIRNIQLSNQCHDQGAADGSGNWTWFELVILENPGKTSPRRKDGKDLAWTSHANRSRTRQYGWAAGKLFDDTHPLIRDLEVGNAIGVRACARYNYWSLYGKDGCLVVELAEVKKK